MTTNPPPTRKEQHLAALDELLDLSMELVRQLAHDATVQPPGSMGYPDNSHRIQTSIAFHHIARAVRRTILLARKLEEPNAQPTPNPPNPAPGTPQDTHAQDATPVAPMPDEEPDHRPGAPERAETPDRLDHIPSGPEFETLIVPHVMREITDAHVRAQKERPKLPPTPRPRPPENPSPPESPDPPGTPRPNSPQPPTHPQEPGAG